MLFLVIIMITHIKTSECVRNSPGRPIPHAEVLDDLLSKFLGDSYSNNALFDFILGESKENKEASITGYAGDNLDINTLDVDSLKGIIDFAKKKYEIGRRTSEKTRRKFTTYPWYEAYDFHPYIVNKSIDLMKHTIYMTQEKINYTRAYRKKYSNDIAYQVALLYGSSAALLTKMESLLEQMKMFEYATHFIWYLTIYEKILAGNVDIHNAIERLFMLQEEDERSRGGKKKKGRKVNLTAAELKELLEDPVRMQLYMKQHGLDSLSRRGGWRRGGRRRGRN